jgi:hypothetical protein
MKRFAPVHENYIQNSDSDDVVAYMVVLTLLPSQRSLCILLHLLIGIDSRYAKDIKTALLAADIIVNQWGFKDYRLDIYGALDKSPTYTTNCQEIIATKSLRSNVFFEARQIQSMFFRRLLVALPFLYLKESDSL